MKRITTILVLLAAMYFIASPAFSPGAFALTQPVSATLDGNTSDTIQAPVAAGGAEVSCSASGDPGGAGDGLGADPVKRTAAGLPPVGPGAIAELILLLLRIVQV